MKKFLKILVLIGAIMIISGLVFSVIGKNFGNEKYLDYIEGNKYFESSKEFDEYSHIYREDKSEISGKLKRISIEAKTVNINLLKSEDNKIYIEYKIGSERDKNPLEYETDSEILKIREKSEGRDENREIKKAGIFNIIKLAGFQNETIDKGYINIYLPKYSEMDINIENSAGDIKISDIEIKKADLKQRIGEINFDSSKISRGKISSSSGNINIYNSELEKTSVSLDTGNINSENSVFKSSDLINKNGNIYAHRMNITGVSDINVTNGNIDIDLYDPNVNIEIKSINGKINCRGTKAVKSLEVESPYSSSKLNINSTNGNIVIK